MKALNLAIGEAATPAQDFTAINPAGKTPWLPYRKVLAHFLAIGQTGTAPAWAVDGSDDGTTWVADIATSVVVDGHEVVECDAYKYMRGSVTTAAGTLAGVISIWLEAQE
jgi:hypothetical protein